MFFVWCLSCFTPNHPSPRRHSSRHVITINALALIRRRGFFCIKRGKHRNNICHWHGDLGECFLLANPHLRLHPFARIELHCICLFARLGSQPVAVLLCTTKLGRMTLAMAPVALACQQLWTDDASALGLCSPQKVVMRSLDTGRCAEGAEGVHCRRN